MPDRWNKIEKKAMRRALRLAHRGWGRTRPNPMVGAVVIKDGKVVGEGYHRAAGQPHAEAEALRAAGAAAGGATMVVTLEPCSSHGRTPPCTEALIKAGIKRLVFGVADPSPAHKGKARKILQAHGIEVEQGLLKETCENLNAAFFCRIQAGRPFVCLKLAITLDGKLATAAGDSKWVSGTAARRRVQQLRRWADAIMVGAETVRQDNPSLTVREPKNWGSQPRKIVWTRDPDKFSKDLNIWSEPDNPPIFISASTEQEWRQRLTKLAQEEGIAGLLLEGGGELAGSAVQAGIVDQVMVFIAPKILAGRNSRPAVGGNDPAKLTEAVMLENRRMERVGEDYLITGYLTDVHRVD